MSFLSQQVKDAVDKGAKVLTGGNPQSDLSLAHFQPTVLVDVNHDMDLMREESFGPIIGIQKVSNDDEAIGLMNDTDYGLAASVYCQDRDRAKKILEQVDSGTAYTNCCDRVSPYVPWSGRNHSGLGSTLGEVGIRTFTQAKSWHIK